MKADTVPFLLGRRPRPTLIMPLATVALVAASASWTIFAVMGVQLKHTLHLSETTFGALLAMPMLTGGMAALALHGSTRSIDGRQVILGCLGALLVTLSGLLLAETLPEFFLLGAGIGLAGGVFGAGLQHVASQSPPERSGLRLGCYSAGFLGMGFTYLVVPLMHSAFEWQLAPLAYIALILLTLALLFTHAGPDVLLSTDRKAARFPPARPEIDESLPLAQRNGCSCLNYGFFFGTFVALALWLPDYLSESYGLSLRDGATLTLLFVLPGALAQIPGGALADRLGPDPVQRWAMRLSLLVLFILSYPTTSMNVHGVKGALLFSLALPLPAFLALLAALGMLLGLGKGSQMQLLFSTTPTHASAALFAGCLTASALPLLFGLSNDLLGVRSAAFMMVFALAALCTWALERSVRDAERRRLRGGDLSLKG